MSNENLTSRSPRVGGNNGFIHPSIRAIFRTASTLASTVRSASSSVVSTISSASDDSPREQVQWASFDTVDFQKGHSQKVLLLTYSNGFQVWNVEDASDVWELVSKRDGPVAHLRVQPQPILNGCNTALDAARPLLLIVTSDTINCRSNGIPNQVAKGYNGCLGSPSSLGENHFAPNTVKFYSLLSHTYVHTLRFRSAIHSVRCSVRIVAVATVAQVYCFDAATLESTFSVITYPSPPLGPNGLSLGYGPLAVGSRWLAYAPNQPLLTNTGRVSPQHLSPSPGVSPSTSPANGSLVAYYAKESGKQFAAGIVTLGDLGYKALSKYYSDGLGSPEPGSPLQRNSSNLHLEHAGTVHIRDFINRVLVAQFRAHDSPLSALCFDHTGTLLVTASIHGHSINVFRIMPGLSTHGSSYDITTSHVHLYKLSRGVTNAIIQDIAFSEDGHWIVVSSARGTSHLYCISPYGGMGGPVILNTDMALGVSPMRMLPWWCSLGPVKSTQQALSSPPPPVSSSVVGRIKNGNIWRSTVNGACSVANGRAPISTGAVAVVFHDGRHKSDLEGSQSSLKEQLWALSPSGHLIRYAIHLPATGGLHDGTTSAGAMKEMAEARVVVEPLEKWDVSRKANYLEREEGIENLLAHDAVHDNPRRSLSASITLCTENGREESTCDEMHSLFLSKAEVQMQHFRPPLWAKPQISFHNFTGMAAFNDGGEIEIEKIPSRVVEVKRKDLVPVYDRLKAYQFGENVRDKNHLWHGTSNSSSSHSGMYGLIEQGAGGIPIQHSSSGSSCDSEGSTCGSNLQSRLHHAYQELVPNHQSCTGTKQRPEQKHTHDTTFAVGCVEERMNVLSVSSGFVRSGFPYSDAHNVSSNLGRAGNAGKELHSGKINNTNDVLTISNSYLISQGGCKHVSSLVPMSNFTRVEEETLYHTSLPSNVDHDSPQGSHHVGEKFSMQDIEVTAEDAESTDDGNSKNEDYGGEQGDDGWEGAIFPFAEDC
ncbi:hypothetical protein KP509_04G028900 [Ceratopteris richardii]|uniref:BCAS3 domain-containing protein n=1 Tax=Ceratopteris richardii TaxID=49495 RepID=A0A8T2UYF8_CERRI|nr:hypothetical protein KP509_04G028900 [Ceratopteris richardii]